MPQTITIELSEPLYEQLQRAAKLSHQPMETIVEQSLAHSLPPLLEEIPEPYQAELFPLLQMDTAALQEEVRRVFPAERWERYESLLEKKKREGLIEEAERELDALRHEADVLMYKKAYAAVLLKRRGYHPPAVDELPQIR